MTFSWKRIAIHPIRYIPVALIGIYQKLISPFLPPACRFYPSCSTYALSAFMRYGVLKGGLLSILRISKCHPFHPGGFDPLD